MDIIYYGRLVTPYMKKTLGYYMVDDMFKELLVKYEVKLIKMQDKLVNKLKKDNAKKLDELFSDITKLKENVKKLRKKINGEEIEDDQEHK